MQTVFLLMAQYEGRAIVPAELIVRDYFTHLTRDTFLRRVAEGKIELPLVRMDSSQKSACGVHLADLAAYLDRRRSQAKREQGLQN